MTETIYVYVETVEEKVRDYGGGRGEWRLWTSEEAVQ